MQETLSGSSGPRHLVAGRPVGYKHGMRDGAEESTRTKGHGDRVWPEAQGNDPRIGQGEGGSNPCQGHKMVSTWKRILWANAEGLLATRWGINTG